MSSLFTGDIRSRDMIEHQVALTPWQLKITPLEARPFDGRIEFLRTNGLIAYRETGKSKFRAVGASAEGLFTFGGSAPGTPPLNLCHVPLDENRLGMAGPGAALESVAEAGRDLWGIIAHPEVVLAASEEFEIDLSRGCDDRGLKLDPLLLRSFQSWVNRTIARQIGLRSLEDPTTRDELEGTILRRLFALIRSSEPTQPSPPGRRCRRERAVREALEFIDASHKTIRVRELAKEAGVSVRTLEYAFLESLGITPKRVMLLHRMTQARQALSEADPKDTTVTQIATYWGFSELGRFAVEYRKLFDERPSETLRSPRKTSAVTLRGLVGRS